MSTPPPDPYQSPGEYPAGGQYSHQPQQPPPPPQQPAPEPSSGAPKRETDAFFSSLFDFSFTKYVTLNFAKIIYILAMALLVLGYLFTIISAFAVSTGLGIVTLLLGWIPVFIYLVFIRVGLEFAVAMIRTARNTSIMAGHK